MHIQLLYLESTWNQHKNGLAINVESVYILHWTQQGKQMNHSHQQQVAHWQVQNGFLWSPFYISYQQFDAQHLSNQSPWNILSLNYSKKWRHEKWSLKNCFSQYWNYIAGQCLKLKIDDSDHPLSWPTTRRSFSRIFQTKNLHQQLTRVFHWLLKPEGKVLKHNLMHRHILTKDMLHHPSPSLAKIISRSNLWNHILDTCAWVPLKSSGS